MPTGNTGYTSNAYNHGDGVKELFGSSSDVALVDDGTNFIIDLDNDGDGTAHGLILDQGAADDAITRGRSSDVVTGLTTGGTIDVGTNDFYALGKVSASAGGLRLQTMGEDAALATTFDVEALGGTATTTKTTAARALIELRAAEHDGSNAIANITADGNVWAVRAQVGGSMVARVLVDEDGDFYSVTAAQTFDNEDDAAMLRAFQHVTAPEQVVRDGWDRFVRYDEQALIDARILGGTVAEGGLTNMSQLGRWNAAANWQTRGLFEGLVSAVLEAVPEARPAIEKHLGGRSFALQGV